MDLTSLVVGSLFSIEESFSGNDDSDDGTSISGGFSESSDLYGVTVDDVSLNRYVAGLSAEKLTNSKEPSSLKMAIPNDKADIPVKILVESVRIIERLLGDMQEGEDAYPVSILRFDHHGLGFIHGSSRGV